METEKNPRSPDAPRLNALRPFEDGDRIAFYGDSITRNGEAVTRTAAYYRRAFPERNVRFFNVGISGATVSAAHLFFEHLLAPLRPTYVVLAFGVNDAGGAVVSGDADDEAAERRRADDAVARFESEYERLIDRIQTLGAKVALRTPTPYDEKSQGYDATPFGRGVAQERMADSVRGIAQKRAIPLVDDYAFLSARLAAGEQLFGNDHVHPNEKGQWWLSENLLRTQGLEAGAFRPFAEVAAEAGLAAWHKTAVTLTYIPSTEWLIMRGEALPLDEKLAKARKWLDDNEGKDGTNPAVVRFAREYLRHKPREEELRAEENSEWNMMDRSIAGMDFSFFLKRNPGATPSAVRSGEADAVRQQVLPDGDTEFIYTYGQPASPVTEARVRVRRSADGEVRGRLSCTLAAGWFLERTSFPEVKMRCDEAARLVLGSNKGGVFHNPADWPAGHWRGCQSPGSCCAPFAAAWNDASGLYFGIEDAKGYPKTFGFGRTEDGITFSQSELAWAAGSYAQDYWIVMRRVKRGADPLRWYDFADIYREWDRKQSWSATPFSARRDIPAWMKEAPAFTRFSRQWLERPEAIRKFVDWWRAEMGDRPVVAALWGWEKLGTWWGPDYFPCHPSDEVFTDMMKELRGRGFHPFAWPSGYNWSKVIGDRGDGTYEWDGRERFIKPAEGHLVVTEDGLPFHLSAFWLRNGALTTLCGGDPWTHDWWNGITKELARRGCDAVQVDQVVGGKVRTCWSDRHGHPVGNGLWMWQAFRRQLEEMRDALKSVEPDGLVGVEEPNMMYNDLVGIQDYRDLESWADEFASVYSYLYHGYVPTFQSNPFRDEFFSLAHAAVDGQMPFFKPDFAELEPSRPALQNGGFENLVDSVRGPAGWDRLIPVGFLRGVDAAQPMWDFAGCNNLGWLGYAATLEYGDRHGGEVSLRLDVPTHGGRDNGNPVQVGQTVEDLEPGEYEVSAWVRTLAGAVLGALKYGTRAGEMGEIPFPPAGEWTKVAAKVRVGTQLRLVIWAPPGAKFLIDDVRLERDGREVTISGDSPYVRFMKKWIALYQGEGREFLAEGFRIRPPVLECDSFRFAARTEKVVCAAAYESASGARALALANATAEPRRVTGVWEGRRLDLTLPPHDFRLELAR